MSKLDLSVHTYSHNQLMSNIRLILEYILKQFIFSIFLACSENENNDFAYKNICVYLRDMRNDGREFLKLNLILKGVCSWSQTRQHMQKVNVRKGKVSKSCSQCKLCKIHITPSLLSLMSSSFFSCALFIFASSVLIKFYVFVSLQSVQQ